jgi:hypothetical protein
MGQEEIAALRAAADEIERLVVENARLAREWEGRERAESLYRARWRDDIMFQHLDTLRRQIAGVRPGDAEQIALAQSRMRTQDDDLERAALALADARAVNGKLLAEIDLLTEQSHSRGVLLDEAEADVLDLISKPAKEG